MLKLYQLGLSLFGAGAITYALRYFMKAGHPGHWFYLAPAMGSGLALITFKEPLPQFPVSAMITLAVMLFCSIGYALLKWRTARVTSTPARWQARDSFVVVVFVTMTTAMLAREILQNHF